MKKLSQSGLSGTCNAFCSVCHYLIEERSNGGITITSGVKEMPLPKLKLSQGPKFSLSIDRVWQSWQVTGTVSRH